MSAQLDQTGFTAQLAVLADLLEEARRPHGPTDGLFEQESRIWEAVEDFEEVFGDSLPVLAILHESEI